jgi:nifR3 family TIM-barrel protein
MTPSNSISPDFYVDKIPIYGRTILSPMDGFSDWPFRSICRELGSAISYTEFINVNDILSSSQNKLEKMDFKEDERPVAIQLYGNDSERILEAALRVQELKPDFIDINMGCPSKSIANRGAGVGLMRTPLKIARIFRKLSANIELPITGKIRLGWDDCCLNYSLIARIIAENGGKLLAVHGRTKVQGYTGAANWDAITEVVDMVDIPVIGNGDIHTVRDIQGMMDHTGCAAVMIGRAAIANPWIFQGLDRDVVPPDQVKEMILTHLDRSTIFYGKELGLVLFRKYAARYLAPYNLTRDFRARLLTREQPDGFLELLNEINFQQP